jgi:16S rRNA processing protein RimM
MAADDLILLGRVVATHGIRGQLRVVSYSGEAATLRAATTIMLAGATQGGMESFAVSSSSVHGTRMLVSLKGYDNINQVQHLVGREVYVRRSQLPALDEDEYYWHDLLGLQVVTESGQRLGQLSSIIETGSNDVYVVTDGQRECLIPALADVVVDIDLAAGTMTVSPPEGLLDL